MPALIGPIGTVVNMNQAVNGNALGNPAYSSQIYVAQQTGGQAAIIAGYNSSLASSAPATLATTVLNNMFVTTAVGVTAVNVAALTQALTQAFQAYPTAKGQVINNLANLLGGLEGEASWGPAAIAFNSQAAADYTYSINPANSGTAVPSNVTNFALTAGVDTFTGSTGNDVFSGTLNAAGNVTFQAFDTLVGGLGTDTLIAQGIGSLSTTSSTLQGIETIQVYSFADDGDLNLAATSGVTSITVANSVGDAHTVSGINSAIQTLGVVGNTTVGTDDVMNFVVTGIAANSSIQLVVDGVGDTNTVLNTDNDTININPTSGSTSFQTVNVTSQGSASFVTLNDGNGTSLTTVNASGAAALTLELTPTTIGTVNASTMTGAFTVTVGAGTLNITGGSGGDNINMGGTYTSADTINGGAGTDVLWLTTVEGAAATTAQTNVTNIERIRVTNELEGTIILGNFGATGAVLTADGHAADAVINYLAGTGTLDLGITDQEETTVVVNGNLASTSDVLNVTLGSTTAASVDMGFITANNFETVNLLIQGAAVTGAGGVALTPSVGGTINASGSFGGVLGTLTASTVNASGVVLASSTSTGVTIVAGTAANVTGSNGVDTITGSTGADRISGGSGDDTLATGGGNDIVLGGLGADSITVSDTGANVSATVVTTAAESYITTGGATTFVDTLVLANAQEGTNAATINTTVSTASVAIITTAVSLGTTVVTAGGFLIVSTTAGDVLAEVTGDFTVYQDSNSDGVIGVNDFATLIDNNSGVVTAVTLVGGAVVLTNVV